MITRSGMRSGPAAETFDIINTLCERACSRKRPFSQHHCRMHCPLREQAHSHIRWVPDAKSPSTTTPTFNGRQMQDPPAPPRPCGSGLARESLHSVNIIAECIALFVSKPTPTFDGARRKFPNTTPTFNGRQMQNLPTPPRPRGSGLARESVHSVNIIAECTALFVSKPTPTFDGCQTQNFPAPPLPHSTGARCKLLQHLQYPVRAACSRKRPFSQHPC